MPSKRSAAASRQQRPKPLVPADGKLSLYIQVADEEAPEVAKVAEKFLEDLKLPYRWWQDFGLRPDELADQELDLMACFFRQQIQPSLRPDVPVEPVCIYSGEKRGGVKRALKQWGNLASGTHVAILDPKTFDKTIHVFPGTVPENIQRFLSEATQQLTPEQLPLLFAIISRKLDERCARAIEQPEQDNNKNGTLRMLDYSKSFVQDGVRYFPLSAAAPVVQAPAPTILHWIKNETKFDGEPLQSHYFAPANQYFISEQSIEKAAHRFIKWPSHEPAEAVILGEVKDRSGYIRLPKMAQILGVDHHTIWRWATKGTAPIDRPLDVIKDPASDQYHIRQTEAAVLKKHVPRAGLHAGRRPRPALQPQ